MAKNYPWYIKLASWGVHLYTSLGIVLVFLSLRAIAEGDLRMGMIWMMACFIIDGTDGFMARALKVWEVLPMVSGKSIDYVVDFASHAIAPAFFFYYSGMAPDWAVLPLTAVILLTSALYYGKSAMVTSDLHFEGFPVMWNFVMFFMFFVFSASGWGAISVILIIMVLHFIPLKYLYPSRTPIFRTFNIVSSVVLTLLCIWIVWIYPESQFWMKVVSVGIVAYFTGMVVYSSFIHKDVEANGNA